MLVFPNSTSHASLPFALIHVDIWDLCAIPSIHGYKYFLTIVDDHTRYVWVFPLNSKVDTQTLFKAFINQVERQFDTKFKIVRFDNGAEFIMHQFFNETDIIHPTTCVETPQQNDSVERKHQHLLNVTRALLFQSH